MPQRDTRFDEIAHSRQQKLALLILLSNVALAACAAALKLIEDWNPGISANETYGIVALFGVSWLALLVAAGAVGGLLSILEGVPGAPNRRRPPLDANFLALHRMKVFYAGLGLNLAGLALFTEVTGGLPQSPLVPVLVAFVLTGPQLSRFKTQALAFAAVGVATAVAMVVCERWVTHPAHPAPGTMTTVAVFLALVVGSCITVSEKPFSPYVAKRLRRPSHARLYLDGRKRWRYAYYLGTHPQDSVLVPVAESATGFTEEMKDSFEAISASMAEAAGWEVPRHEWPPTPGTSFTVDFTYGRDDVA